MTDRDYLSATSEINYNYYGLNQGIGAWMKKPANANKLVISTRSANGRQTEDQVIAFYECENTMQPPCLSLHSFNISLHASRWFFWDGTDCLRSYCGYLPDRQCVHCMVIKRCSFIKISFVSPSEPQMPGFFSMPTSLHDWRGALIVIGCWKYRIMTVVSLFTMWLADGENPLDIQC